MPNKEELLKLVVYFIAAVVASLIKFLKNKRKSFSTFLIEMLMGASFAFFIVPAFVDYYDLSVSFGTGLTWAMTMLSESILSKIESKLNSKIDDTIDNIDK